MACTDAILTRLTELLGGDAASSICAEGGSGCTLASDCAIVYLASKASNAQAAADDLGLGLNVSFLLTSGYLVFSMQLGFAMLCAGLVRTKSQHNILLKNILDACIGGLAWYLVGYGFAFGQKGAGNSFIGNWNFALKDTVDSSYDDPAAFNGPKGYQSFFFQWAFSAAAATIVSGAVAERCTFVAYGCYTSFMTAFTYPVVVHGLWSSTGWLSPFATSWSGHAWILKTGAIDFAGSGVVHMTGGIAALVGTYFMGPRLGRFRDGKVADSMTGHSAHLVVLGTMILWFGWYGFNPGSQLAVSGFANAAIVARVAVTTTLGGCAGGVSMLVLRYYFTGIVDLVYTCNGILCGLVAITAGCSVIEPWAAILAGTCAPLVFYGLEHLLFRFQIDDAVSAFPMHGGCGSFGVLFVGLLGKPAYIEQVYGSYGLLPGGHRYGWFYGGHGQVMLCQLIEVLFILAWVGLCMTILFGTLKYFHLLRVSADEEHHGLDQSMHAGRAQSAGNKIGVEPDSLLAAAGSEFNGDSNHKKKDRDSNAVTAVSFMDL